MPDSQTAGGLRLTAAIRQRTRNYLLRLYLSLSFLGGAQPPVASQIAKTPSKPVLAHNAKSTDVVLIAILMYSNSTALNI